MSLLRALRSAGVLGINRRNVQYTLRYNPRRLYPLVDDKLASKRICEEAGIPVPKLMAVAKHHFELGRLMRDLEHESSFVLKPAHGAMGNGILVVRDRDGSRLQRSGGRWMRADDLRYHAASIISGLYALGGQADVAMVEERLVAHPALGDLVEDGAPDIRVIVFQGVPVMSMTRLPTRRSGGRANLHQGAIGAGIDLVTGRIVRAIQGAWPVEVHPDTGRQIPGIAVPGFERALEIAVRAADQTGLGYVGADVVLDAQRGPVILELNARPGLQIQVANGVGLLPRLRAVEARRPQGLSLDERITFGLRLAVSTRPREAA